LGAGGEAQCGGQMRLAGAGVADQQQVFAFADVFAAALRRKGPFLIELDLSS